MLYIVQATARFVSTAWPLLFGIVASIVALAMLSDGDPEDDRVM